ncbi:MAG: TlpA family protein disulfide reductase [Saprospiraceae bacterium]|nr:TlpA family protein disulfide reductase [Saprospiraceae bacterium]
MKKISPFLLLLILINIALGVLAFTGFFEGKDLLPILLGGLFVVAGLVFLFVKRKEMAMAKLVGFAILLASSWAVNHLHFNVYSAQKVSESRENSIEILQGSQAPTLTYSQSFNQVGEEAFSTYVKNHEFTILNFWATWCAPCLKEMPLLDEFYQKNQGRKIGLVGFTDYRSRGKDEKELNKIKNIVDKLHISYPILVDSTTKVRAAYRADVLPATVLIDNAGNVLDYQIGIDGAEKIMAYVSEHSMD